MATDLSVNRSLQYVRQQQLELKAIRDQLQMEDDLRVMKEQVHALKARKLAPHISKGPLSACTKNASAAPSVCSKSSSSVGSSQAAPSVCSKSSSSVCSSQVPVIAKGVDAKDSTDPVDSESSMMT